jgi:phospholipid/cholesterol/gamma-HCH transport system substrate-binding protein
MKKVDFDLISGVFVFFFLAFLAYYSVKLGNLELFGKDHYGICALFDSVSGLEKRAEVEVSGVNVGKVNDITFDQKSGEAKVCMDIDKRIKLQDGVIASVRTDGLVGSKFISLSQGDSNKTVPPGGNIVDTESSVDFEKLIYKFLQGKK